MMDNKAEFDIDRKLEKIIEKYNLDRHYPAYRSSVQACAFIRNWVENFSEADTKVLFITMNDSVLWLIRGWATRENINVIYITDVEQLDNHVTTLQNADKIYTVAYTRAVEILHWLWRHDFQAESVYDILENRHIYCQMEFYRFFPPFIMSHELELDSALGGGGSIDGVALPLYEYYYQTKRLQHALSEENKKRLYEKLFFLAIYMKNFIEAERLLKAVSFDEEYENCWQEIKALLNKIKEALAQNSQKHIIIYWLDSLSFEDAENLEYLQERRRHSLYFRNAFTLTPNTFPTFKTMFYGIRQVDDLGYQKEHIGLDDSPLLQDIIEHGYDFKLISNYINRRMILKDNCNYYGQQIMSAPCSEAFWSLANQMIQSRRPTVYLVQSLVELHSPRLSVRRNFYEKNYNLTPETWQVQFDELNDQLRFYDQMIDDNPIRIYMGDHGARGIAINRIHVCFQIYHAAWENREIDKLFCFLDFPKVMHKLLMGENIDGAEWDREYVPIQDVDYYNPERLKNLLAQKELDVLPSITSYKGVVTNEYIYAYFKTGDELFHRWSNGEYKVIIDFNNIEKDTIFYQELRKKAGGFPKELDFDPKFQYAQNTYVILENVRRTLREAVELLNKKLAGEEYGDGSIVLRPGGYHTLRLCAVLSEDSRKKIGGIIDRNPDCICRDLGYRIYQPEDKLPDTVKFVLLSTFANLTDLKHEVIKCMGEDMKIIDIYQYWKDCGYAFSKNFWFGLDLDRDIEFLKD